MELGDVWNMTLIHHFARILLTLSATLPSRPCRCIVIEAGVSAHGALSTQITVIWHTHEVTIYQQVIVTTPTQHVVRWIPLPLIHAWLH
eukprot:49304-Ditylum_brightwellii.AAC.1